MYFIYFFHTRYLRLNANTSKIAQIEKLHKDTICSMWGKRQLAKCIFTTSRERDAMHLLTLNSSIIANQVLLSKWQGHLYILPHISSYWEFGFIKWLELLTHIHSIQCNLFQQFFWSHWFLKCVPYVRFRNAGFCWKMQQSSTSLKTT